VTKLKDSPTKGALECVSRPISTITPYPQNARKIPPAAVDKVAASIKEFGWRQPIVVDPEGVIIVGHVRLMAAKKLKLHEVPVHVADNLSKEQVKAYRLMDNRSHDEATWDFDLVGLELEELGLLDFDLSLTGWDADQIDAMFAEKTSGLTDPDEELEPPANPVSVAGDLWILGNHRLLCGDATRPADVEKLLAGVKPGLMITDPPYGVEYDATWRAKAGVNKNKAKLGVVLNDDRADWREAWALFPGHVAYIWHGGLQAGVVQASLEACGLKVRSQIIWAKDRFALSRGDYHWKHEPCWYAVKGTGTWAGDRSQTTVWEIKSREDGGHGHSTQKPVEAMRRPMLNNSSAGQAVYDPFVGAGTSIIAAEMEGRHCYAIELSPAYVDVTIERWQRFTGKLAARADTGETFDSVRASSHRGKALVHSSST